MERFFNKCIWVLLFYMVTASLSWAGYAEDIQRDIEDSKKAIFADATSMEFHSPLVIKLKKGSALRNAGSQVVVTPQGVTLGEFKKMVEWEFGLPNNLKDEKSVKTNFYFDFWGFIRTKKDVLLKIEKIERHTEGSNDSIFLIFMKGSPTPEVIRCGKLPLTRERKVVR